ncbi:hypothetical protein EJ110_NYTH10205 [Nymphaea thermarum]|nr:hypothetical protein EJ110_NYTH10205 [Nymphaea thermarum]
MASQQAAAGSCPTALVFGIEIVEFLLLLLLTPSCLMAVVMFRWGMPLCTSTTTFFTNRRTWCTGFTRIRASLVALMRKQR